MRKKRKPDIEKKLKAEKDKVGKFEKMPEKCKKGKLFLFIIKKLFLFTPCEIDGLWEFSFYRKSYVSKSMNRLVSGIAG